MIRHWPGDTTRKGLTLAISTLGAGIERITLPPPAPDLSVLILWQAPEGAIPPALVRDDVTVERLTTRGLSISRNVALERVTDGFVQFWDDDMIADPAGLETLRAHLIAHPERSVVTGRRQGLARADRLVPGPGHALTHRTIARTASPEIMVRVADVRRVGVRFDPAFGLGARHPLGEEFIFLGDLLAAGLNGWHLPVAVGNHPPQSTGDSWADPTLLQARAAAIARVFGRKALAAGCAFAWKNRTRMGIRAALRFPWMCLGARP